MPARRGPSRGPPCFDLSDHGLQPLEAVSLSGRHVPAQAVDAGKAHRQAGLVPRRALQALEGDFQDQALVGLMYDLAYRAETVRRVAADEAVDLQHLFFGKAKIGLAAPPTL